MIKKIQLKKHLLIQIALFFILIAIDQITKYVATVNLKNGSDLNIIDGIISFHYLENNGAAFGSFQNKQWLFYILTFIVLIALIVLFCFVTKALFKYQDMAGEYYKSKTIKDRVFLNYIFVILGAGAVGNLIDRIIQGYVVDFINCYFINFPVFNFADICVTVAAFILVIFFIFVYKDDENFVVFKKESK